MTCTFIEFILDETGSMSSCHAATVSGFSEFVKQQQEEGQDCFLTLTKFDSSSIHTPYVNLPIDMVPPLTFYPGAMTNLYDVVGDRLTAVLNQGHKGKSLVVIMTDGGENASQRHTIQSVQALVKRAIEKEIVVVYLGPVHTAMNVGRQMGIPDGNIKPFSTDRMAETISNLSASTRAFRASAETATSNFF